MVGKKVSYRSVADDIELLRNLIVSKGSLFVGTLSSIHRIVSLLFKGVTIACLALDEVSQMRWVDTLLVLFLRAKKLFVAGDLRQMYPVDLLDKFVFSKTGNAYDYYPSFLSFLVANGVVLDPPKDIDRRLEMIDAQQIFSDFYINPFTFPPRDFKIGDRYRLLYFDIFKPKGEEELEFIKKRRKKKEYSSSYLYLENLDFLTSHSVLRSSGFFDRSNSFLNHWRALEFLIFSYKPDLVLSPYTLHVSMIKRFVSRKLLDVQVCPFECDSSTVRLFQGAEKKRVIIDFTLITPFLDDQMVVTALTRQKKNGLPIIFYDRKVKKKKFLSLPFKHSTGGLVYHFFF